MHIYLIKVAIFILFLLSSTVTFFSALHAKHFEIWKNISRSGRVNCFIAQSNWYFWVFVVNPISFFCSIFFSRKFCFLWFPCLLLIAESIILDTSGKPTVEFFLKITSPSWIILSISLFWRIYLNIIFWILLWMLSSLVIWNLNITLSTSLKYCYKKALNEKLELIERAMKYFPKKLLGHEIFRSKVSWATNFFLKNL